MISKGRSTSPSIVSDQPSRPHAGDHERGVDPVELGVRRSEGRDAAHGALEAARQGRERLGGGRQGHRRRGDTPCQRLAEGAPGGGQGTQARGGDEDVPAVGAAVLVGGRVGACPGRGVTVGRAPPVEQAEEPARGADAHEGGDEPREDPDGAGRRAQRRGDDAREGQRPQEGQAERAAGARDEADGPREEQRHDRHGPDEDRLVGRAERRDRPLLDRRGRRVDDGGADGQDRRGLGGDEPGDEVARPGTGGRAEEGARGVPDAARATRVGDRLGRRHARGSERRRDVDGGTPPVSATGVRSDPRAHVP